jgi:hypothetical protein
MTATTDDMTWPVQPNPADGPDDLGFAVWEAINRTVAEQIVRRSLAEGLAARQDEGAS